MSNPSPDRLHERARLSAVGMRQLLIGLATASIGFYYGAIFKVWTPPLTEPLIGLLLFGIISMGLAVLAGIVNHFADAQWNYWWAKQLEFSRGRQALHLMSVSSIHDVVAEGRDLTVVALVGAELHIRIFDDHGDVVANIGEIATKKGEKTLVPGRALTDLKALLTPLPVELDLSRDEKKQILELAKALVSPITVWAFWPEHVTQEMFDKKWKLWQRTRRLSEFFTLGLFLVGILFACLFVYARADCIPRSQAIEQPPGQGCVHPTRQG